MDMFNNLITIERIDGTIIKDVKSSVQKKIHIKDTAIAVDVGDVIKQKLPSGIVKRMLVTKVNVFDMGSPVDHIEVEYVNA